MLNDEVGGHNCSPTFMSQLKLKHMTETALQAFSNLVDINWEIEHGNHSSTVKMVLINHYWDLRNELIDEMGADEFKTFMEQGRRMFAPAD